MSDSKMTNGLVDDIDEKTGNPDFLKRYYHTQHEGSFSITNLLGNIERNSVSSLFFSKKNIQALQNGIRYMIYKRSNETLNIPEQSIQQLILVMRTTYMAKAKNQPFNIVEQVRELNKYVLDYAVPEILNAVQFHNKYLHDVSVLNVPMKRSLNTSIKGDKILNYFTVV